MRTSYVPDFDDSGAVTGLYTVTVDVHDLTVTQEKLKRRVEHDALTDVLSRRTMMDHIERALDGPVPAQVALYFVDLDGFKAVNDRLGHDAGDRVLCEVAARLQGCVRRANDLVSRNGGDEFAVVLRGLRPAEAAVAKIAEQIGCAMQRPIQATEREQVLVGVSIGMASFPFHGQDLDSVLHRADIAMYEVKRTGKNSFAMALPAG
jgi:diguanylate cyclase (GGDEF)-like protein